MSRFVLTGILLCIASIASAQQLLTFPSQYYPPTTRPRVAVAADIPRIKQEILSNPTVQDVTDWKRKVTQCLNAVGNVNDGYMWDYRSGAPAATCALQYVIDGTNNSTLLNCAKFWLSQLSSTPLLYGRLQPIYYYAIAYDLIYNALSAAERTNYNGIFIGWSNNEWTLDHPAYARDDRDSDHNAAAWTGHLYAGVVTYGDDTPNAVVALDRAWTVWTVGVGGNPNQTTDWLRPVGIEKLLVYANSGMNLPGFDYSMIADNKDIANGYRQYVGMGVPINGTAAQYWLNMLQIILHATSPDRLHWRWVGDFQADYHWDGTSWCRSYLNPPIYWSTLYGYTQWASWGKGFRDTVCSTAAGRESDQFIALSHTNTSLAGVSPYTGTTPSLIYVGNVGVAQQLYFRDSWDTAATWGSFSAMSNRMDHMPTDAGGFHLWRGGQYLTTFPPNYGGYLYQVWNTLWLLNNHSQSTLGTGNALLIGTPGPNSLDRVRTQQGTGAGTWVYAMANIDNGYNESPAYTYDHPVATYRRHFVWISPDLTVIYDRVYLTVTRPTAYRYRGASTVAPTISGDTVRSLSDGGSYQLMTRFMLPATGLSIRSVDESTAGIDPGVVDTADWRHLVVANVTTAKNSYNWLVLHHISASSAPQNILASAQTFVGTDVAGSPWDGVLVLNNVLLFARLEMLTNSLTYTVPNTNAATYFHLVADLQPGCYVLTVDGTAQATALGVATGDNTLAFASAGSSFAIASTAGSCSTPTAIPTASPPTNPPASSPGATTTAPTGTTTAPTGTTTAPTSTTTAPTGTTTTTGSTTKPATTAPSSAVAKCATLSFMVFLCICSVAYVLY